MRKTSGITLGLTLVVAAANLASGQAAAGVARDKNGRIARSERAKDEFKRETGFPHGRPGYVIDHIVPLANGGRDAPSNMQWQTTAEAKAKDRYERGGFGKTAKTKASKGRAKGSHGHAGS